MRALLSVYDKTGLVDFARALNGLGWELVSSGGTSAALADAGIDHVEVADLTGAPEMLGGRVKTLHPTIHGGILADRTKPDHLDALDRLGIGLIDLVVCNLYPFTTEPSIELIDVGGPTMVRAAAKNHDSVGVVVDPSDYDVVIEELKAAGELSVATKRRLARQAFAHTAGYDAAIVEWLDERELADREARDEQTGEDFDTAALLPPTIHLTLERAGTMRYGENPHQHGARYRIVGQHSWWDAVVQHGGKGLSYLNVFDADAAWRLVHELAEGTPELAVAIIKHANPCGAALDGDLGTGLLDADVGLEAGNLEIGEAFLALIEPDQKAKPSDPLADEPLARLGRCRSNASPSFRPRPDRRRSLDPVGTDPVAFFQLQKAH